MKAYYNYKKIVSFWLHTCDIITCHEFVGYELIAKAIKGYDHVIGMNASKSSHVWGHDMDGYGKALVPHKYPRKLRTYN